LGSSASVASFHAEFSLWEAMRTENALELGLELGVIIDGAGVRCAERGKSGLEDVVDELAGGFLGGDDDNESMQSLTWSWISYRRKT
jgi:hypothetical protein